MAPMSVRIQHAPRTVLETLQPAGACRQPLARLRRVPRGEGPPEAESLDDLRLPFTRKADLRETYPFGMFAVPREKLRRIHASSGTGQADRRRLHGRPRRLVGGHGAPPGMAGVPAGMVVHNAYGYGLFTGGLGFHQGGERLGCTVVPMSGGNTARQGCSCATSTARSCAARRPTR